MSHKGGETGERENETGQGSALPFKWLASLPRNYIFLPHISPLPIPPRLPLRGGSAVNIFSLLENLYLFGKPKVGQLGSERNRQELLESIRFAHTL